MKGEYDISSPDQILFHNANTSKATSLYDFTSNPHVRGELT